MRPAPPRNHPEPPPPASPSSGLCGWAGQHLCRGTSAPSRAAAPATRTHPTASAVTPRCSGTAQPEEAGPTGPHRHGWMWPLVTSPEGVEKEFYTMSVLQRGHTLPPPPPPSPPALSKQLNRKLKKRRELLPGVPWNEKLVLGLSNVTSAIS